MESEQAKSIKNGFCRSECAETRSNGSKACPCKQNDYVSRVVQNCRGDHWSSAKPSPSVAK